MIDDCGVDLRQLPVFMPDARLWPRVVAEQHRRLARRRRGRFWLGAAAAAICAGAVLLPRMMPSPQRAMLAGQQESQALEQQWRTLAARAQADTLGLSRVRAIDAALQAAYDRGARANELAPLWQKRNRALRDVIAQYRSAGPGDALAVTRI